MSTYSGKGDQWTIENPKNGDVESNNNIGPGGTSSSSTVRELTKDLLADDEEINTGGNDDDDNSLGNELDFGMGESDSDASDKNVGYDDDDDVGHDEGDIDIDIGIERDTGIDTDIDIDIDSDHGDGDERQKGRSAPGRRKKKKHNTSTTLTSQPQSQDDDAESGDESVDMKGESNIHAGKNDGSDNTGNKLTTSTIADDDDEDDQTVALSVDGRESDDEDDRTVAFSDDDGADSDDDEDDRTIAMSVVNTTSSVVVGDDKENTGASSEGDEQQRIITNQTIAIPASTSANNDGKRNDSDDDDLSQNSLSDMDTDNDDEGTAQKQITSAKRTPKPMEESKAEDSDDDDGEMEFDMPPAEENHSENEESAAGSTKSVDINSKDSSSDVEEGEGEEDVAPKEMKEEDHFRSPSASSDASTPRRSVRARKPRPLYAVESVLASSATKKKPPKEKAKKSPKQTKSSSALPKDKEWIAAADVLFVKTEDKSAVTVKQIFSALEEQFECKITKQLKTIVRNRLKALITGTVEPSCATEKKDDGSSSSDNEEVENESGEDGKSASESESSESDSSEDDADDEASDYSDGEDGKMAKQKKKKERANAKKKKISATAEGGRRAARPKRRKATARAAAKVVEAHKLRQKKRAEELKVRNEEMQLDQTKEDEERQEAIAAKFETNTDELRLKRLEDRLDLLQRLDETRISVVAETSATPPRSNRKSEEKCPKEGTGDDVGIVESEKNGGANANGIAGKNETTIASSESSSSDSDDESSSDEEDLVIVGMKKPFKPLKPLLNHLPSRCLQLLDEIGSPRKNKKAGRPKFAGARRTNASSANTSKSEKSMILSPNRSIGARFALRNALMQKQRKQGNRWLARELGYKTEEDHLKDCQNVANQKRGLVVKLEQERLKTNERKQLRERLMLQEQQSFVENNNDNDDPEDEEYVPEENNHGDGTAVSPDNAEEEDEEMKMAREIEQEARDKDIAQNVGGEKDEAEITHDDAEDDANTFGSSPNMDGVVTQPQWNGGNTASTDAENDASENASSSEMPVSDKDLKAPEKTLLENEHSSFDDNKDKSQLKKNDKADDSQSPSFNSNTEKDTDDTAGNQFTKIDSISAPDESVVTPEKKDTGSDDEGELEFDGDDSLDEEKPSKDPNRSRNAGWQAMLEREAEKLKKRKKRKSGLVDEEAEEEEEEEIAGLEDFGFSISKKNKNNDEEDDSPDKLDEDDLKHIVDDVSDDEGDEDAGRVARKQLEQQEEKTRHKEILRRMREGYDGRRGGIAGGGAGARGMHRFDQLVAADNRDDAKRLGLLNDDEFDSEDENGEGKSNKDSIDDEEDETALLDKILKDRFLHRSDADVEMEENFSDDEEKAEDKTANKGEPQTERNAVHFQYQETFLNHCFSHFQFSLLFQKIRMRPMTKMSERKSVWQSDSRSVRECNAWRKCTGIAKNFHSNASSTKMSA